MMLALLVVACVLAGAGAARGQKPERGRDPHDRLRGILRTYNRVGP